MPDGVRCSVCTGDLTGFHPLSPCAGDKGSGVFMNGGKEVGGVIWVVFGGWGSSDVKIGLRGRLEVVSTEGWWIVTPSTGWCSAACVWWDKVWGGAYPKIKYNIKSHFNDKYTQEMF